MSSTFIAGLCFFTFVVYAVYTKLNRKKFIPSEVIIGNRKYYNPEDRVFINVLDFDGVYVYFTIEDESELAEQQVLTKEAFLDKFIKIPSRLND